MILADFSICPIGNFITFIFEVNLVLFDPY